MPGRILIVDDVPANIRLLEAKLSAEYYEVLSAIDGPSALALVRSEKPDIILLDVMMPGMDGFEVTRRLKADPETSRIPVVLLTALSDVKDRVEGLRAGADDFLTKPVQDISLFARVRSLLRLKMMIEEWHARDRTAQEFGVAKAAADDDVGRKGRLLLIEPNTVDADNIAEAISPDEHDLTKAVSSESGAALLAEHGYDLLLISSNFTGEDCLRFCSRLRGSEKTRHMPILLLADSDDKQRLAQALDLGVNDFIVTPADADELRARIRIQVRRSRYQLLLRQNFEQSLTLALTDTLTGVYNRRYFDAHIQQLFARAQNADKPLALVAVDIDHFKRVNDTYGHGAGDKVLREVARRMADNLRNLDMVARMGGEEFFVVMPDTPYDFAMMIAERLRQYIAAPEVALDNGQSVPVTISLGVAIYDPKQPQAVPALMETADQALYQAKHQGRNRVIGSLGQAAIKSA
jgi:two-component system cell cycle response regulator